MGDAPMKAALAAVIGLSLSTMGLDSNSGVYRFTGDNLHLSDGIQFIVVVIGLFSISEILLMLEMHHSSDGMLKATGRSLFNLKEMMPDPLDHSALGSAGLRGRVCPVRVPPSPAPWPIHTEKRLAGASGTFGEGDIRGVAAPEAANNASAAGSFVPMLTWACRVRAPRR
jgi:putative tricarboxylic transport membrane protein